MRKRDKERIRKELQRLNPCAATSIAMDGLRVGIPEARKWITKTFPQEWAALPRVGLDGQTVLIDFNLPPGAQLLPRWHCGRSTWAK